MDTKHIEDHFPGLTFSDLARERLAEVIEFCHKLCDEDHEAFNKIATEFFKTLDYLSNYGEDRFRVELHSDFAPLSFSLGWFRKTSDPIRKFECCDRKCWHKWEEPASQRPELPHTHGSLKEYGIRCLECDNEYVWADDVHEYVYAWPGGLIWHGGSNDPLCVTLSNDLWGVHT